MTTCLRPVKFFHLVILLSSSVFVTTSCKKFLEEKSDQTLATPSTLEELQGMLDNPSNNTGAVLHNTATDEYYFGYTQLQSRPEIARKTYRWDADVDNYFDWVAFYNTINYANNVLWNLEAINGSPQTKQSIKGQALFFRSYSFYELLQVFAPQYHPATADIDLGIVLRLDADFNTPSFRSSVAKCYQQIINDLEVAASLLPNLTLHKNRPNRAACFGLLARVSLQKGEYNKALEYARQSQALYSSLLDYNSISLPYPTFPIPNLNNNPEILFYSRSAGALSADFGRGARADTNLVSLYSDDDVRKKLFFIKNADNSYSYRAHYTAENRVLFTGIATDEILLISAECEARLSRPDVAANDLNKLLSYRYKPGTFSPYINLTSTQALQIVLQERRKQLICRGVRWSDLKRLNKDPQYAITLKRFLNGTTYELPPNDRRYVFLIPSQVINITGMPQNPR